MPTVITTTLTSFKVQHVLKPVTLDYADRTWNTLLRV